MLVSVYDIPIKDNDKRAVFRQAITKGLLPKGRTVIYYDKRAKYSVSKTRLETGLFDINEIIELLTKRKIKSKTDVRYYKHWGGIISIVKKVKNRIDKKGNIK